MSSCPEIINKHRVTKKLLWNSKQPEVHVPRKSFLQKSILRALLGNIGPRLWQYKNEIVPIEAQESKVISVNCESNINHVLSIDQAC